MANACSGFLVTVATLDKRPYKYMAEKQGGLYLASNQPLSAEHPVFAPGEQISMPHAGFVGCCGLEWPIPSGALKGVCAFIQKAGAQRFHPEAQVNWSGMADTGID